MRILGIDPALRITGYGIIEPVGNNLRLVEAGVITTPMREPLPQRLAKIYCAIINLIEEFRPTEMVLEKLYAHYRHPTTAYLLGQARGVICLISAQKNISFFEYGATRIKKAILGKGLASKYQIQRMVASLFKLEILPKYSDVTDALALAIAHSYILKVDKIYRGRKQ
jgi:crossover junction endodeoxyribonuclease RuvC